MSLQKISPFLLVFTLCSTCVFSDTVWLKSEKKIEGEIIARDEESVQIDNQGFALTYYLDDIEEINGKTVAVPVEEPPAVLQTEPIEKASVKPPPVYAPIYIDLSSVEDKENDKDATLSVTIDGRFDDWTDYVLLWNEAGGVGNGMFGNDIDIKKVYSFNDDHYFYLFFETVPTIKEREKVSRYSGILAYVYIDSDNDPSTGLKEVDDSGNPSMIGSDIKIWIPLTSYSSCNGTDGCVNGLSVSCSVKLLDDNKMTEVLNEKAWLDEGALINHGPDGVELAIPLTAIKKKKGDQFKLTCIEWTDSKKTNESLVTIK